MKTLLETSWAVSVNSFHFSSGVKGPHSTAGHAPEQHDLDVPTPKRRTSNSKSATQCEHVRLDSIDRDAHRTQSQTSRELYDPCLKFMGDLATTLQASCTPNLTVKIKTTHTRILLSGTQFH